MVKGKLVFVLHSHLPYVLSHGKWPHGMDWINEAAAETYIPLIQAFEQLVAEGVSPKVTVGITPVLTEMLADEVFKNGFSDYVHQKIEAAAYDAGEFYRIGDHKREHLARMWETFYRGISDTFVDRLNRDIPGAFRRLQDEGHIEIITCAATHGYLPLLGEDTAIQAQVRLGVDSYRKHYGKKPRGIWLPECAYRPAYEWEPPIEGFGGKRKRKGIEEFLSENDIDYFIVDSHLLSGGEAVGVYLDRFSSLKQLWANFERQYKPIDVDVKKSYHKLYYAASVEGKKPVAFFTRDPDTGLQVWSGEHGYPGDGDYLDFHKKHFPGGHRYWKVTSSDADLADKDIYEPENVDARIRENASHFKSMVHDICLRTGKKDGNPPVLCAPFDAELFGHWWFEGPRWLYHVLKEVAADPDIETSTMAEYYDLYPPVEVVSLPEGSWGKGGFHWIWLNDWTKWTWKHIYENERIMQKAAEKYSDRKDEPVASLLKLLARELVLLESSDWQFLISTWSARDYAEMRFSNHHSDFLRVHELLEKTASGENLTGEELEYIKSVAERDNLFEYIEPKWWSKIEYDV
ncbi:glycoside hydrolase family 57 protein [Candidatus Latescibacterota bacterium]